MEKKRCDAVIGNKIIVYLHGFGSSGQSGTVKHLRKIMPEYKVLAPDIPVNPAEALPFLKDYCKENKPDLVIGTSMGGMYAMQMYDYKRICVNPALRMSELTDILKVGTFEYFQPTLNGDTHFTITADTIQQFRDMEAHMFDGVNDENRHSCWGFFGDEDTTVNCREEFEQHFGPNVQTFHGGHRMNNHILDEIILPFVKHILEGINYNLYQVGDRVRFISTQPSEYASRYGFGNYIIEPAEYIGIVKNVKPILDRFYMYTIMCCTPIQWICLVFEDSIIEKLPDEQSVNDGKKDLPSSR